MATYIEITKTSETDDHVVYEFAPDGLGLKGKLRLEKSTGEVQATDDSALPATSRYFAMTATKVRQHWKNGNYPDATAWAS